jgi:hypothetical protein
MKISYAITVCNELEEIKILLSFLTKFKRKQDEIVVLVDQPKASEDLQTLLKDYAEAKDVWVILDSFENNFADWKNKLTSVCHGDYIVNIDADELPAEAFMDYIEHVIEGNPEVDVLVVPRWNTVKGLTQEHITKWGWRVDHMDRVNWPDYQTRIYKNNKIIQWINPVHEKLTGYLTFAPLPDSMYFNHHKTIERQEKQNQYYGSI